MTATPTTPTPATATAIPPGYRQDAQGRLVPEANIKEIDLLRDQTVRELFAEAQKLNAALAAFRGLANATIASFTELSAEKYGVKLGGRKGNISLVSFDGRYKVIRSICDQLVFDERIQAAKVLVDECLKDWATGAKPEIHTIINDAFKVDQMGKIDTQRVLSLRNLDIKDERWLRAMEAISDSLKIASSRSYLRFYERVGDTGREVALPLDLANA